MKITSCANQKKLYSSKSVILVGSILLSVLFTGCKVLDMFLPITKTIPAEYKLAGKRICIVPFKSERFSYFQSPEGIQLSRLIESELRNNIKRLELVPNTPLEGWLSAGGHIVEDNWSSAAIGLDTEYLMVGEIRSISFRPPGGVNVFRGRALLEVVLHKAGQSRTKVVWRKSFSLIYPRGENGIPSMEARTEEDFREEFLKHISQVIVNNFHTRNISYNKWRREMQKEEKF